MLTTAHEVISWSKDDKHEALVFGDAVDVDRPKVFNEETSFEFLGRHFPIEKHDRVTAINDTGTHHEGFLLRRGGGRPVAAVFRANS
jgi:hypothetical protein